MSGLYLLDTNVVLALVRGSALGTYIDTSFRLSAGKRRPAISVVTHAFSPAAMGGAGPSSRRFRTRSMPW